MDKIHSATRPPWALTWLETVLMFLLGIFLSTTATLSIAHGIQVSILDQRVKDHKISEETAYWIQDIIISVLIWIFCFLGLHFYKKFKTHRYPGTYIYCFKRKDKDTNTEISVLGYFTIECLHDGGMVAHGASFDWNSNGQLPNESRVRWESKHIGASEVQKVVTCYVIYDVHPEDAGKRPYKHGLLKFGHLKHEKGIIAQKEVYHGHMQAVAPLDKTMFVYEKAYGERVGKEMSEQQMREKLTSHGDELLARWQKSLGGET